MAVAVAVAGVLGHVMSRCNHVRLPFRPWTHRIQRASLVAAVVAVVVEQTALAQHQARDARALAGLGVGLT